MSSNEFSKLKHDGATTPISSNINNRLGLRNNSNESIQFQTNSEDEIVDDDQSDFVLESNH